MNLFQDMEVAMPMPMPDCFKYVSIFQIDGQPILPPLMTSEKRIEMQMYREKAIQLERKFADERQERRVQFCQTHMRTGEFSSCQHCLVCCERTSLPTSSSMGEESLEGRKEESFPLHCKHSDCSKRHKTLVDCGTNTSSMDAKGETKERLRNLSKSKTIFFDNMSNDVLQAMNEEIVEEQKEKCREVLQSKPTRNNLCSETRKTLNLSLQNKSMPFPTIPSIYVNPPTPLTGPNNICEVLSAAESVDSNDISGFQSSQATQNQVPEITEDSEDDSQESILSAPQKRITGGTARVLHFENVEIEKSNGSLSSQLPIDGEDDLSDLCLILRSPQRSATSPSLKSLSETLGMCSLTTSPRAEDTSAHSLVRSSSFTLEGPSKALLDHIRQQKSQKTIKEFSDTTPTSVRAATNRQRSTPSPSAWRDTVESKAKRVQKKTEGLSTSRASSSSRSKSKLNSFNTYPTSSTSLWTSPLPPLKVKRSPYDSKGSHSSTKSHSRTSSAHKMQSSGKLQKSNSVKKSASSTTYTIKQVVPRCSMSNNYVNNANNTNNNDDLMLEIDNRHRQKLVALLAQQQEEQRRLQQTFEAQQKMLLDQLNNERYFHLCMETESPKEGPHIKNVSKLSPVTSIPGNDQNSYKQTTAPKLDHSPPHTNALNGPTQPSTNETTSPTSIHSSLQRPLQVAEVRSPLHTSTNTTFNNNLMGDKVGSFIGNKQPSESCEKSNQPHLDRINAAATVINACARGFLVRRLFQTEQIQRIVQTIRDTLIFVLNLHMETMENIKEANTAENIKLKARLLQQLASASRTLHLIFFQTSVKERMDIISRDRKRIKAKLLSKNIKRSPRVA